MAYDALGNLINTTDADGIVTQTAAYDSMRRGSSVKDTLGIETTYSYDTMGNLIEAVKALNAGNGTGSADSVAGIQDSGDNS